MATGSHRVRLLEELRHPHGGGNSPTLYRHAAPERLGDPVSPGGPEIEKPLQAVAGR